MLGKNSKLRLLLSSAVFTVLGGHARWLKHKQEYHRRRGESERKVLDEARTNPAMLQKNVCPACGDSGQSSERFSNPVGFSFAICPLDGAVYMDPVPSDETLARLYADESYSFCWTGKEGADDGPKEHGAAELETLLKYFPGGGRPKLLDIGCATGGFMKAASRRFDCEGVELSPELSEIGRRSGMNIITGRVSDMPGSERFDAITMLQVIEHIPQPKELLIDCRRLLKRGGILYFNTPNADSASFKLFRDRHMHVSSFGHVSLLTRAGVVKLAERCGLVLEEHSYSGRLDIDLHDLVSRKISPARFRHRMALYSPRLFHACTFLDTLTLGRLVRWGAPRGNLSYQYAVLRKPS